MKGRIRFWLTMAGELIAAISLFAMLWLALVAGYAFNL